MTHLKTITSVVGVLALGATPALAVNEHAPDGAGTTPSNQGTTHAQTVKTNTPGPKASLPAKAKAYGKYCQGESKKHVAGEKGTPFSQCVTAMARAANNEKLSPGQACKGMSKKHVKGEKGTPFSRCVKAAAKLRKAQHS
jgi:hypothetical protein